MSATDTTAATAGAGGSPPRTSAGTGGVTLPRVALSEWIKLRSLRSTWITVAISVVIFLGLGMLITGLTNAHWSEMHAADRASFDPTGASLAGVWLAQLAVASLGVMVVTGEYATGMIRASLSAVPRRLPVIWAKAIVFAVFTFVAMLVTSLVTFEIGQALLGTHGTSLSEPHVMRAVLGVALYLTAVGLLSVGLGFVIRSTAGTIATVVGLLLVLPILVQLLPESWRSNISPYLPSNAGSTLFTLGPDPNSLGPWVGFGVLCAYAVVALGLGAVLLVRRDA